MERDELIKRLHKVSCHFALTDEQKEVCIECAKLLQSDAEEITFLKDMQRKMVQNYSYEELGQIVVLLLTETVYPN